MFSRCSVVWAAFVIAAWLAPLCAADPAPAGMATPEYAADGQLVLPTDFREWVFVGSSMGLSYFGKEAPDGPGLFHHIYMQPEAFRHYEATGTFPQKTMLVMENYSAGSKEDNTASGKVEGREKFGILHGHFEDALVGMEVALKDSARFEDEWAYFMFSKAAATPSGLKERAKAMPKAMCWSCHDSHAADDNVFVQFYPVLRKSFEARHAARATAARETAPADEGSAEK